ncbi:MAG: glycosyltransferase [Anaerovibrio sp.]|uniref:glycosyltransferase n=1 Tax=Anaerovibrio sp. TaxID=1872532 RepID=UPI001B04A5FE|nr:glycosyltransferase [Anaerovibrio sp.]MBO6245001.1 glycosyltransferase [Anaerovibrio sp.]MBP3817105.1 glycosyltransferase [Butyrivibrio sp.]
MKISAIYIAKNEAENIARSIESVKDSVDELILVDTGSTDNTVEIFKSYGGQVYFEPWNNDFATPRNKALSKATGDWVILLDADEFFTPKTRKNICNVLENMSKTVDGLLINMTNIERTTGGVLDKFLSLRIVRNIPGLQYQGRIHEELRINGELFSAENLKKIDETKLSINHTGYSRDLSPKKAQRNLEILLDEIEHGRPIESVYRYLYDCYTVLGNEEEAIKYAKLNVLLGRQNVTFASRCYLALLTHYAHSTNRVGKLERYKWAKMAAEEFPELPEFQAEYAESLAEWYRFSEATVAMDKALAVKKPQGIDSLEISALPKDIITNLQQRRDLFYELADKAKEVKLSACVIVKNEASNLPLWLQTSKNFADEIIVVDTGSTDDTVNIAKQAGAKVIEISWEDDFSVAKNTAINAATGDWVIFNDADETFYNSESVRGFLTKECIGRENVLMAMFPLSNIDEDNGDKEIERFDAIRAFKNQVGLRYKGAIHEVLSMDGEEIDFSKIIRADDRLLVKHTGYSASIVKQKTIRNIQLLLKGKDNGEISEAHYGYLAESYFELGNYEKALNYSLRAIQSPYMAVGQETEMHSVAAFCLEKLEYSIEDRLALIEDGLQKYPMAPDFYSLKGICLAECGEYQHAYDLLTKGLKMYYSARDDGSKSLSSYYNWIIVRCHYTLGICSGALENHAEAIKHFKDALDLRAWDEDTLIALGDYYDGNPDDELISLLDEYFDNTNDNNLLLSSIWELNGFDELRSYYQGRLKYVLRNKKANELWNKYRNREYEVLLKEAKQNISLTMQLLFVSILSGKNKVIKHSGKSQIELLPLGLQNIIRIYFNEYEAEQLPILFSDYMAMLPVVIQYGSEKTLNEYLKIGERFTEDDYVQVAHCLKNMGRYKFALSFYELVTVKSNAANSKFWHGVGICLYHMNMYDAALECFERTKNSELTQHEQGEKESYIAWCKEVLTDDA